MRALLLEGSPLLPPPCMNPCCHVTGGVSPHHSLLKYGYASLCSSAWLFQQVHSLVAGKDLMNAHAWKEGRVGDRKTEGEE